MKNLSKLFLAVLLSVAFFSCSDDDNDYGKSDLKGTWIEEKNENIVVKTNDENMTKVIVWHIETKRDADEVLLYFDGKGGGYDGWYVEESNKVAYFRADDLFYDLKDDKLGIKYDTDAVFQYISVKIGNGKIMLHDDVTKEYSEDMDELQRILAEYNNETNNAIEIDIQNVVVEKATYDLVLKKVSDGEVDYEEYID
ncbi:hypothetical protein [Dysgonomonas massiliensis]|uniref:hypothetical protein n=1 Tax=Dysgonomonas massiliensis TaxID=2040292 RepID=UPI000C78E024|nr:hypothetical protein [Dysgonomonas massiliensis]